MNYTELGESCYRYCGGYDFKSPNCQECQPRKNVEKQIEREWVAMKRANQEVKEGE